MSVFYELEAHVGAGISGLGLQCRPSGVLELLQEAATQAAGSLGLSGPEVLERYGGLWMVSRMWYRLERPLMWDETVKIRTWHRADRGAMFYRDFDLFVGDSPVGEAVSVWVLVDAESRKLLKLSGVEELEGSGGGDLCKDRRLGKLRLPREMALAEKRRFHYSDIDCNGHVNNVRYADVAADALGLEGELGSRFVSSLQIGYLRECRAGEEISIFTGSDGETRYVHGVDEGGESRFDAALTLAPLPEGWQR